MCQTRCSTRGPNAGAGPAKVRGAAVIKSLPRPPADGLEGLVDANAPGLDDGAPGPPRPLCRPPRRRVDGRWVAQVPQLPPLVRGHEVFE